MEKEDSVRKTHQCNGRRKIVVGKFVMENPAKDEGSKGKEDSISKTDRKNMEDGGKKIR